MKKKIKDLNVEDIPKCWSQLFSLHDGLVVLFIKDLGRFDEAKKNITK